MTSRSASNLQNTKNSVNQPLHYFTGQIRAYWKNVLFFSDARNVAFVDVNDLYVNGKLASYRDLAYLEELVQRNYSRGPELHSYVSDYHGEFNCPWPHELSGKMLWKAKCAWYGFVPHKIKYDVMDNIVYMPVSYYTGKIVEYCNDSILFGDSRNSVMVSLDHFYCFSEGDYYRNVHRDSPWHLNDKIHAYIIRLDVLSDKRLIGPLPCIPNWPQKNIASDMWVAKFAWQGEIPEIVKDQVERFYTIRMNRWDEIHGVPWIVEDYGEKNIDTSISWEELSSFEAERNVQEVETKAYPSLVPVEQKPGLMKGSLLLADENMGLMTSFADVIAFKKDSFYINGNKFIQNYDLSYYFKDRIVPLTAWVIPMEKPKLIFNVHVVWEAVCVWCGTPPKDLENIKKKYRCGKICKKSLQTSTSVSFTHFIGKVKSLSFASGVLISRPGLEQQVKISFKRKAVYIHGSRFHSSCSLLDKQQLLESCVWSVLAYPVWIDVTKDVPLYHALAVWHYDDQHSMMNILNYAILDTEELTREVHNAGVEERRKYAKEKRHDQRFSGWIAKVTENYGIIQSGSALVDAAYLYFKKEVLYVDGVLFPKDVSLLSLKQGRQCNVEAKTIPLRNIGDYEVTLEATLVWIGKKPFLESSGETTPQSSPTHTICKDQSHSGIGRNPGIAKTETNHNMRTALSSTADSQSKLRGSEPCAENERVCMKNAINGVSDHMTADITAALSHNVNLGGKGKGDNSAQARTTQLNDSSVIASKVANSPSEVKDSNTFKSEQSVSDQEFCGKYVAAHIIKKTEKGGIAQWKSLQFKGYIFIEFSREILYLDMKPISKKWKVANVESRPCNLYVIPVPHHNIEECIVSLKATCGWIGKKPPHIPSAGTQLLSKIDLSSVHVCQEVEIQDTDDDVSDSEDDPDDDLINDELGDVEIPLEGFQNIDNVVNVGVRSGAILKSDLSQSETSATEKTAGNITNGIQNLHLSKPICSKESKQPTPVESRDKVTSKSEVIWGNDDKRGFQTGVIVELHSSVGQLLGADGSTHFFSRDNCFLYGVSLRNVELWHVLAQDDPVRYTVLELVPGMVKIQRVWIGFYDQPYNKVATEHILAWCKEKLVPDGARDILVSQIEMK